MRLFQYIIGFVVSKIGADHGESVPFPYRSPADSRSLRYRGRQSKILIFYSDIQDQGIKKGAQVQPLQSARYSL